MISLALLVNTSTTQTLNRTHFLCWLPVAQTQPIPLYYIQKISGCIFPIPTFGCFSMDNEMFQSYAVVLSSHNGSHTIRAYQLSASPPMDMEVRADPIGDPYTSGLLCDIFDDRCNTDDIQIVIDRLLKYAYTTIQNFSDLRGEDTFRDLRHGSRHDAVPLYYVCPKPSLTTDTLMKIATAVHSSGYDSGYRFRIIPRGKGFQGDYTFKSEAEAETSMTKDFEPRKEATAVCHEPNTAWSITPYFRIQNRAHDCGMILDRSPHRVSTVQVPPGMAADEPTYVTNYLKGQKFSRVYIACPETVDDRNKEYNLRYRQQLGMGCFPGVQSA
ncbi:hypothetical protein BGX38DRAFT_1205336 [Terfezia claveryi]|nr:hypothetical protein BGX38DRAFT_1205336 [Terfezia claveryi]